MLSFNNPSKHKRKKFAPHPLIFVSKNCLNYKYILLFISMIFLNSCINPNTYTGEDAIAKNSEEYYKLSTIKEMFYQGKYPTLISLVNKEYKKTGHLRTINFNTEILKYKAFSECLINKTTACKNTFIKIRLLNPDFNLKDIEKYHPQWANIYKDIFDTDTIDTPS